MKRYRRDVPDIYSQRAAREGYPARSVYKLAEIEKKFKLFKRGMKVVDLGAAPGSWTLYLLREFGASVKSVDLKPFKVPPKKGVELIVGNIFDDAIEQQLKGEAPFDALVSDAASSTTGNRVVDTSRSVQLVERALQLAENLVSQGGITVIKIFQGEEHKTVENRAKEIFSSVRFFKPASVRGDSFEHYLIGEGKRAGSGDKSL